MLVVFLTALGVGGATVAGSALGFLFKSLSQKISDVILSFAAGIMLSAAILGLILPAVDSGSIADLALSVSGIFLGAFVLTVIDRLVPHIQRFFLPGGAELLPEKKLCQALLFVTAIAIHNFPEGLAAGVSFGCDSVTEAVLISGGIALQNIPEGMVIITPMLSAGIRPGKTFLCALFTGLIEVFGTFVGYFSIAAGSSVLPFALGFAGGTMLYVISNDMIPETRSGGSRATISLLAGFCIMLAADTLLG